jgi:16S rRNA (adenine1518-N6/adenine1519-N6)-dimethyltransferase
VSQPPADRLGALAGGRRPPWSAFRAELDAAGFRPSRSLGQNFLVDPNAVHSIATDAGLARGARVLEVGAGCGFLSLHLAELGVELLAAEIDERLLAVARRLLSGHGNVRWWLGDALEGKHALAPGLAAELPAGAPWHLVSNLPYSIAAPLLAVLARRASPPSTMTVLVQEEVARRIVARPGDPEWGALSARLGLLYAARAGRAVGAQLFWPRPRVASRVVRLEFQGLDELAPLERRDFEALVDGLFARRRKQLAAILAALLGDRHLGQALVEEVGLDPRARPETLTPGEILALARSPLWRGRAPPGNPGGRKLDSRAGR